MTNSPTEQSAKLGIPRLTLRLWRHLHPRRRKQFVIVSLLMGVSAFAEVFTLGAVIPFITVLVDPERVFLYGPVAYLAKLLGVTRPEELVLPLAMVFVAGVLLAAAIRLAVVWSTSRLAVAIGADLSAEAYERTLYQPYSIHIGRSTSEITSGVIHKVEAVVNGMFAPLQVVIGSVLTMVTVTGALLLIDPVIAMIAMVGFGGGYVAITWVLSDRLKDNSRRIAQEQTRVVKAIQEGVGGIRDVLIDGTQTVFLDQFRNSDRPMRQAYGSNTVIQRAPRVVMEAVAMLLVAMLAVVLSGRSGGIAGGLPILGALALGGQRLLPVYQQCYQAVTSVLGHRSLLVTALEILDQPMPATYGLPASEPLEFRREVKFENLRFRYTEHGPWVIDGMDLAIAKGARVGMVGPTGCGKSTLLDLLMGLLTPVEGAVLVDELVIEGNRLRAWQRSIAHVPQHIFLADASLTENIAFGVPVEDVNMELVREAASRAMIAEFIDSEPAGYATMVGERGIRLSGGQRQRIGIARALYKQASVLVFDEATSALDSLTEQSIVHSLSGLDREVTVMLVAHRLSTLKDCDMIVEMNDGRIVGVGTFECLMSTSATFREMALAAEMGT
ncbi:MAG: ABC transporter ATP-binding protein [Chloroflexi bacterium]|nr:ABC transporter ATP-binding protein [Chloroflexota bacterium]